MNYFNAAEKIDFDYSVKRIPGRRTISIQVDSGWVVVRAPARMQDKQIRAFVESKSGWVRRKQAEARQRDAQRPRHLYLEGEMFPFQGSNFRLTMVNSPGRGSISIKGDRLILQVREGTKPEKIPAILKKWYIELARAAFLERVSFYSAVLGVAPASISVRSQKSRWGSCSSGGNISLNWKLVTAPPEILDYVVAHELCHLKHRNHKPAFWDDLGKVMPDFQARRKWLRENGHKLGL
ncbi:MAG: SprT family zinc-dependent metalloprotease [Thermoplasmata archaeon]